MALPMSLHVHVCPANNPVGAEVIVDLLSRHPELRVTCCEACGGDTCAAQALIVVTGIWSADELVHVDRARHHHPDSALIVLSLCEGAAFHQALHQFGTDHVIMLEDAVPRLMETLRTLPGYPLQAAAATG
jgi:hypothetical protein